MGGEGDRVPQGRDSVRASFDDLKPGSHHGPRSFLGAGDREGTPALSWVRCPPAPCLLLRPASPRQHPLQQRPPLPPLGRGSRGSCQTLLPPRGLLLPQVSREPHVPTFPGLLPTTGPLGAGSTSPSWAGKMQGGGACPWGTRRVGVQGACHPARGCSVVQDGQRFIWGHPAHLGPLQFHRRSPETLTLRPGRV